MNEVFETDDNKDSLEEILKLTKENNKILKKQLSAMRWSRAFKVVYWIIIVGIALGSYYYIQPYIDGILNTYQSIGAGMQNINKTLDSVNSGIGDGLGALEGMLRGLGQ